MSWSEGFFSFSEEPPRPMRKDIAVRVSTESLLMEGARRIDEWSRIADIVPNLAVVPELAPIDGGREGAMLDLLPHEWQVLTMIDGERDLRGIAAALARDEFEIAKIAYGLATTEIIALRSPRRATPEADRSIVEARLDTARAHTQAGRHLDAVEELRRAVQEDPLTARAHLDLAFAAARVGDLTAARAGWEHFIRMSPRDPMATLVHRALGALAELERALEVHANG
jgi:tetratricopeptide (TPR) repeat protein